MSYTLRGGNSFSFPHTRKSYIKNSLFWLVLDDWNRLDLNIRESNSGIKLSNWTSPTAMSPIELLQLASKTSGQGSVQNVRIRMGLSALNAHRRKYSFINDNACRLCDMRAENIFTISFSFARPNHPTATPLPRVLQRNLSNQSVLFSTPQSFVWVTSVVTKWLKTPTARCKLPFVWCSGTIYCKFITNGSTYNPPVFLFVSSTTLLASPPPNYHNARWNKKWALICILCLL